MKKRIMCLTKYKTWTPFVDLFGGIQKLQRVTDIEKNDVVLFEGGTDISSYLYKEPQSLYSGKPDTCRDMIEMLMFRQAHKVGATMLGICRGSQFLTAMNGGTVIQHCHGHTQWHNIQTYNKKVIWVSSTHHQMMNPFNLKHKEYEILGWAAPSRSDVYLNGYLDNLLEIMTVEPEIVWYPKTRSLAIQGHPEYMRPNSYLYDGTLDQSDPFVEYSRKLIKEYLL